MAESFSAIRRPAKRPIGRKTAMNIINIDEEDQKIESFDNWGFSTFKVFLDRYLSPGKDNLDITLTDALKDNIEFFKNLKEDLNKRYRSYEDSFARTAPQIKHITQNKKNVTINRSLITRSQSAIINFKKKGDSQKTTTKEKTSISRSSSHHEERHLTSQTIWHSTQKFFGTAPTQEIYEKYIKELHIDTDVMPLGPHFSISFNRRLRKRFNNPMITLKVPSNIATPVRSIGNVPVVQLNRALAALVPVSDIEAKAKPIHEPFQDVEEKREEITKDLNDFEIDDLEVSFPTGERGTSRYSKLSFEEKLTLEVMSIGLTTENECVGETDNEVMNEIRHLQEEFKKSEQKTLQLHEIIAERLAERQNDLIEKIEKAKIWTQLIEKAEKENKAKAKQKNREKHT